MRCLFLLITTSLFLLHSNTELKAQTLEDSIGDYIDVEVSDNTNDLIMAVANSVCQLRSSLSEEIYKVIDPRDELNGKARIIDTFLFKDEDRFYCSGVVVSNDTFFTAGHCNQVNIEQNVRFGTMELNGAKYIKQPGNTIKFERNLECEKAINSNKPECRPIPVKVRLERRLHDVYFVCNHGTDKEKRYLAPATAGWANPRFAAKRPIYDTTIWHVDGSIDPSIPRAPYIIDQKMSENMFKKYGRSCKTIGYGPMDVGNPNAKPDFKILNTPVTGYNREVLASQFGDYLRPGDSGGGIFCLNDDKKYHLVGINSRSYLEQGLDAFSLNSFNADWITIMMDPTTPRLHEPVFYDQSPVIFHHVALQYELKHMQSQLNALEQCYLGVKHNDQLGFAHQIKKDMKAKMKRFKEIVKTYKKKNEPDVVIRSFLFELFDHVDRDMNFCLGINPSGLATEEY